MLDDGAPEGLALLGVRMGSLQRGPCPARGLGRDADAAERQVAQRDAEAPPDLAENVAGGHPHVLEDHLAGVVGAVTELVLLGDHAVAGVVGRRDERGHAPLAGARIGHRHDHRHIGARARRDERLVTVQHVLVAVSSGPGADGRRVGASVGLSEVDAAQPLAAGELGEVVTPLLVGARLLDRHGNRRVVRRHHVADAAVGSGDLLDSQRVRHEVGTRAAPAGVDNHPHEPDLSHLAVQLSGRSARPVPLCGERRYLALRERPGHVADLLLLVGQLHGWLPRRTALGALPNRQNTAARAAANSTETREGRGAVGPPPHP